jgi:hypothetical protein
MLADHKMHVFRSVDNATGVTLIIKIKKIEYKDRKLEI